MIIVRLISGMGNQMFQYAFGYYLAKKYQTELKLDLSFYKDQNLRKYELDCFTISSPIANMNEVKRFKGKTFKKEELDIIINRYLLRKPIYKEKKFNYDSCIELIPDNSYIWGYWQSEKYFKGIENHLRSEFTFKKSNLMNLLKKSILQINNSVSIHIRRTDYINNPITKKSHGLCSLEYYQKAIKYVKNKISNPYFCIFTDDVAWVKENFKLADSFSIISDPSKLTPSMDMELMSLCNHHITANSTFSWWGAWLNPKPDKIVISPLNWFNELKHSTTDLIPDNWIRL